MTRRPQGRECECTVCGSFFTGEEAFDRHLLRSGCQPPGDVRTKEGESALFCHQRSRGPTWSMTPEGDEATGSTGFFGRDRDEPGVVA